jgi:hypothetical protein
MKSRWLIAILLLGAAPIAWAQDKAADKEKPRAEAEPVNVPYRLIDTHHVMVRCKINGKGPFNFIVDTGCPVLIVSTPVGKKLGLKANGKGWAVLDKLELEGGLTQEQVKCRVETPFQIEGMNAMGLPGVELHGLLGYQVIAKYKMEFDFKDRNMRWTPLDFDPPPPMPLGGSKNPGLANLEAIGGLMKIFSALTGIKPGPPPVPRGFFGFEVTDKDDQLFVSRVLAKGPAAAAGLMAGDRIEKVEGEEISSSEELFAWAAQVTPGRTLTLGVNRRGEKQTLKITAGNGL